MPSSAPPRRGVRVGLALCALGLLAILVDVLPFFAGADDRPLWLNLACLLLPLGLVVAIGSALLQGRREQQQTARAIERATERATGRATGRARSGRSS